MQAIPYFLKDTVNSWYQSLVNKPQDFNAFKAEFLRYFSNNNSINHLVNTFTTMKQEETEVQLMPTISQSYRYSTSLSVAYTVTRARDFESTESEANHTQAINLVMNRSSELDSKLEKFSESINKRLKGYLAETRICHYCGKQRHIQIDCRQHLNNQRSENQYRNPDRWFSILNHQLNSTQYQTTYLPIMQQSIYQPPVYQAPIYQPTAPIYQPQPQVIYQLQPPTIYQLQIIQIPPQNLSASEVQRPRIMQQNWKLLMVVHQPIPNSFSQTGSYQWNSGAKNPQNPNSKNYLSLLELTQKQQTCTSNILPATVTNDELLDAIFLFKLEELSTTPLFSRAALEEKPITAVYTDVKIDGHHIKLILNSGLADSIITRQLMNQLAASARIIMADGATKTSISEIDNLPIEINGIIVLIKVLIMEATQYQALVGNDWLSKTNATLDWNTQELQLIPATCDHFKATNTMALLIDFEEEKQKPTWEAYQVLWTDEEHNELLPILSWDDNGKGKKGKEKEEGTPPTVTIYNYYTHYTPQQSNYRRSRLVCIDCGKKLLSIGACCGDNEEYHTTTKFYCYLCLLEHFGRPKRQGKWNNQPCLTCGEILLDEGMWNNISGCEETCDTSCQYTILISNWVKKETPIEAQLDGCLHNDDEIWRMAIGKIEGATSEEIREIKNNPPEPIELNWDAEPVINFLEPEDDFEYCDNCDIIYNPPPHMIYTIPEEEEPISSCASELKSLINHNPDSDDNNKNTSFSSIQNSNDNKNNSNSDSNSNLNYEQYIALPDLSKKQELK
ncbi:hypothetical protein G9A89_019865 [Geosiphon pyriformis]|nr:hypothetical protein G9A89_019865 [Geosiphon pyriformis]